MIIEYLKDCESCLKLSFKPQEITTFNKVPVIQYCNEISQFLWIYCILKNAAFVSTMSLL